LCGGSAAGRAAMWRRCAAVASKALVLWCPCSSWSGAEGPIDELGRWPVLWSCDGCGSLHYESFEGLRERAEREH
jgi:hypothetical protein